MSDFHFTITDDAGDEHPLIYEVHSCSCGMPGCVEDRVLYYPDGRSQPAYHMRVPGGELGALFKGLLDGTYRGEPQ